MHLRRTGKTTFTLAALFAAAFGAMVAAPGCGGDDPVANTPAGDSGTTSTPVGNDSGGGGLTCAAPATKCGTSCVDTANDPKNCGACGTACAAGLICSAGACGLQCAGGATKCGDACSDTDVDSANCGACGKACKAGEVCSAGACGLTCAAPLAKCDAPDGGATTDGGITQAFCAKVKTDSANCGACGTTCAAGLACIDGTCSATCATSADCGSGASKCVANKCVVPSDCSEILSLNPRATSGAYTIDPDGNGAVAPFTAWCDMVTDGGGWTIVASYAGVNGEEGLTSDVEKSGNPLLFGHSNLNRAKKIALSALSTETIILRKDGRWLKADKPMFNANLAVANSEDAFAVKLNGTNGAVADGYMGWANFDISGGGDFGISVSPDVGGRVNGFDHHSTNYRQLNNGCGGQYFHSYSAQLLDGDQSYKSSVNLGGWTAQFGCNGNDFVGMQFFAAMRRHVTAPLASCTAIKAARPAATDGWYVIDRDGAGGPNPPVGVYCDMTTDGGGYTLLPVTGGISTFRFDVANSCDALGLATAVGRTKNHLNKMAGEFGLPYVQTIPGVYGLAAGDYRACAMNSGDATCAANWKAVGGGAWFARAIAFGEPNGDYVPGCWLSWGGYMDDDGAAFNDGNCGIQTGQNYLCSDNLK